MFSHENNQVFAPYQTFTTAVWLQKKHAAAPEAALITVRVSATCTRLCISFSIDRVCVCIY